MPFVFTRPSARRLPRTCRRPRKDDRQREFAFGAAGIRPGPRPAWAGQPSSDNRTDSHPNAAALKFLAGVALVAITRSAALGAGTASDMLRFVTSIFAAL